ncbi:MAG TPA: fibronectin type III domain-containing protein, partial [Polyangium sp.]|nr:fibronectin type III domain-containing protein [Polyangium sp.]
MKDVAIGLLCVSVSWALAGCGEPTNSSTSGSSSSSSSGGGQGGTGGSGGSGGSSPDGPPIINASQFNTVLGRPTDSSIGISVLATAAGDKAWIEYGTQLDETNMQIASPQQSSAVASMNGEPMVFDIGGLSKNTKYYYRVHYQPGGLGDTPDNLHTFRTQRAAGSTFHFGVQGDTHPERAGKMFHAELFTLTMEQVRDRQPDLYFTLGDDFSIEKIIQNFKDNNYGAGYAFHRAVEGVAPPSDYQMLAKPFSEQMIVDGKQAPQSNAAYLEMRQKYLGIMANATSLMLVNGNHEQAHLANLGGVFNNASIWAADARLKYYPL